MIGHVAFEAEAAEPAIGEVQMNLLAQSALGADGLSRLPLKAVPSGEDVMRMIAAAISLCALLAHGNASQAQSYEAPGGDTAVTEPGGTEGRDGRRNIRESIQDGELVGTPRREGVKSPQRGEGGEMRRVRR